MSVDTVPGSTETQPQSRYLTPAQRENLIRDIAAGQLPYAVIAAQYGRTHQYIRLLASQEKERIAELRAEWHAEAGPVPLWIRDKFNRLAIRQGALISILEQQSALVRDLADLERAEDPNGRNDLITLEQYKIVRDQWVKLEQLKQQILRHVDEIEGQLPTRAPAVVSEGSKMTYEVKGVDVAEVVKSWGQGQQ